MQRGLKSNTIKSHTEIKIVLKYRIFLEYHRVLMMSLYSIATKLGKLCKQSGKSGKNQGITGKLKLLALKIFIILLYYYTFV